MIIDKYEAAMKVYLQNIDPGNNRGARIPMPESESKIVDHKGPSTTQADCKLQQSNLNFTATLGKKRGLVTTVTV